MRILILGAGCTGLGAAYRLQELGHDDFLILEGNSYPGGLAASFVDDAGFTWDLGGHVQFSHYDYFDRLMDRALGQAWLHHVRESYIWIRERFIPYPFQNNLRQLPSADLIQCLQGLAIVHRNGHAAVENFEDWIVKSFGRGIADLFLLPYNFKVWACPLSLMSHKWVGERVAQVDLSRIMQNIVLERDDPNWGPNQTFRFPVRGGTGAIWISVARMIPEEHIRYDVEAIAVDTDRRVVTAKGGEEFSYDVLISSLPLDVLTKLIGDDALTHEAKQLRYSTTHVVGIGVQGAPPEHLRTKNWLYFPEDNCPFYRVTVFSNYSPHNAPPGCWSMMAEVAESVDRPVFESELVSEVIRGMRNTLLLKGSDQILSAWHRRVERGYPTPTRDRDEHVDFLFEKLESCAILSRGRFGAWRYEVANQDHSCMQGVEAADRALFGAPELTVRHPELVNAGRQRQQRVRLPENRGAAVAEGLVQ